VTGSRRRQGCFREARRDRRARPAAVVARAIEETTVEDRERRTVDIDELGAFPAGDDASFVTGLELHVDGG
jgi:NAD(P)-dependent dehydrogenase (short-subunit alcohol dehydrogenase family)